MGRMERNGQGDPLLIGGRYRLVEKLGTGGMSVVWRGHDEILGRPVAVKVLSPRLADDSTFRDRLRQEALAAARLNHPHITGVFDFGESPLDDQLTVPFVVMELHDGESVAARLTRGGPFPWRAAVTVAAEVASALATAHARGVVHRDVTPANVMLTGAGAKVVDFGIAAVVGQRDAAPDGSLLGTPAYLAPERLAGAQVSAATDVYALGLLLYRALTGRLPWPAETTAEALRAHLYAAPDPLPTLPGLPAAVRDLCLRCLAKTPTDRPRAAEVARVLAAEIGMQPVIPPLTLREAAQANVPTDPLPHRRAPAASPGAACASSPGAACASSPGAACASSPGAACASSPGAACASSAEGAPPAATPGDHSSGTGDPSPSRAPSGAVRVAASHDRGPAGTAAPLGLGRALLAYLGLPGGAPGPRPAAGVLRLRAGLRLGRLLRVGRARPLGGGLFVGGGLVREVLTGQPLLRSRAGLRSGRYRTRAALMTMALVGAAGAGWAATHDTPDVEQAQAAGAAPAAGPPGIARCAVRYQLRRDSGADYEALLTVATTDEVGAGQWRVQFSYPGTQHLTRPPKAVTQKGRRVVAKGRGTLQTFTLRGSYDNYNPLPLTFTLDGRHRCRVEILGALTIDPDGDAPRERSHRSRKSSAPRKRVDRSKPSAPAPAMPPPPTIRPADGFSLAL